MLRETFDVLYIKLYWVFLSYLFFATAVDGKLESLALTRVLVEKQYLHFLLSWYSHNERAALFSDRAAVRKGGIALDSGCESRLHHVE